jgi:hypothetical protein
MAAMRAIVEPIRGCLQGTATRVLFDGIGTEQRFLHKNRGETIHVAVRPRD